MSDQLERDFLSSPGEHKDADCWCGHPREWHEFDAVRDYRELRCVKCACDKAGLMYPLVETPEDATDA